MCLSQYMSYRKCQRNIRFFPKIDYMAISWNDVKIIILFLEIKNDSLHLLKDTRS